MERLTVEITAQDGATRVFEQVADGAEKVGTEVELSGRKASKSFDAMTTSSAKAGTELRKTGDTGARALDKVDKEAKEASRSIGDLQKRAAAAAAGFGALAAGAAVVGRNYRNARQQVDAITRAYTDQADAIIELTEKVQEYTRFSNDQARESSLIFHTLAQNYGISIQQIDELMIRSADLAQLRGFALEDVSLRLQSALRGEAEASEALGVTLNDTYLAAQFAAQGFGEWHKVTDDLVKAQFRFQELMRQTAYAAGTAADEAATAGGQFRQIINVFDDAGEAAGRFIGPVGEIAAEMMPLVLMAPVVGAGMGKVTAAVRASTMAAGAGRIAVAGLGAAMSPLGLAIGGVLTVGGLLAKSWMDQKQRAEEYRLSVTDLELALEMLRRRGDTALAAMGDKALELGDAYKAAAEAAQRELTYFDVWLENRARELDIPVPDIGTTEYHELLDEWYDIGEASEDVADRVAAAGEDIVQFNDLVREAVNDPNIDADAWLRWSLGMLEAAGATETLADDHEALQRILNRPLSDFSRHVVDGMEQAAEAVRATRLEVVKLFEGIPTQLDDLRIGGDWALADQFAAMHDGLIGAFTVSSAEAQSIVAGYEIALPSPEIAGDFTTALTSGTELAREKTDALGAAYKRITDAMKAGTIDNTAVTREFNRILADTTLTADEKADAIIGLSQNLSVYVDRLREAKDAQVEWLASGENILDWWDRYTELANSGGAAAVRSQEELDAIIARDKQIADMRGMLTWVDSIDAAGDALDQTLRTYRQIDALGQRSSSAGAIADALFGPNGNPWDGIGPMRDAFDAGYLSYQQFIDAIDAGVQVQESNERVQTMLNAVRSEQLPLLAASQEAYEENIKSLLEMEPLEQRRALMLQDTSTQTRIAELYSTAYAATIGQIPEAVATDMIVNAAKADAALKDLLLNLGLITETDGEITVNFPNADLTTTAIQELSVSIDLLTQAIENLPIIVIDADDNASGPIADVRNELNNIDGKTATVYVQAVQAPLGVYATANRHGGIAGYAGGGVIPIRAGEAGPEIAHFAGGGAVVLPHDGYYGVPRGTYIEPHNSARSRLGDSGIHIRLDVHGNVYGIDDLAAEVAAPIADKLTDELQRRRIGAGVR